MNFKYRITNETAAGANKRNIFVAVAGKLIKPGESCYALRIDQATRNLAETKDIRIEEGTFVIGVDTAKKPPPQNAIVDVDDEGPIPYRPPVSKSVDEPLSARDEGAPRVTVSSVGSGKPPIMHSPTEPFKDKWQGEKRATPPEPLAKEDMPERFVMPAREGTVVAATPDDVAKLAADVAKPDADKGGVKSLGANFDLDADVPDFGGSNASESTTAPATPSAKGGKKSKP